MKRNLYCTVRTYNATICKCAIGAVISRDSSDISRDDAKDFPSPDLARTMRHPQLLRTVPRSSTILYAACNITFVVREAFLNRTWGLWDR